VEKSCGIMIFTAFTYILMYLFSCVSSQEHCYAAEKCKGVVYYVSLSGNDSWTGKIPEPNRDKTDGPFATFVKARDTIRTLKQTNGLPKDGITVFIRGGIYSCNETFSLTSEDSGSESSPITWKAYPGEEVHFIGGKTITGFQPVADSKILKRFDTISCSKILQSDLKSQGILNYNPISSEGWGSGVLGMELFFKSDRMTLARYPNEGWLLVVDVPQLGNLEFEGCLPHKRDGIYVGRHYGRFVYDGDRPERWAESDDIWMHGYWTWDWADIYQRVDKIDKKSHEIYPAKPYNNGYGFHKNQRYYFLNILEELDSPGEYYIDRKNGILYFWPPSQIGTNDAYVSIMDKELVSLNETSYVTFQGIIFEGVQRNAVKVTDGTNNKIAGCTLRNIGVTAVTVEGGMKNGVVGCDIHGIGSSGVIMTGGDRKTLTPAGNYVTNNHIYNYSVINRTIKVAVNLRGVGNFVSHNKIHDAPHMAIMFNGNENIIEYNEIYRLLLETNDAGTVYTGRNPSEQGNIIRYNYFHHIGKVKGHGTNSVYFDDGHCGNTVFGNVFYKGGVPGNAKMGAMFIHGGRYNIVDNNIFIECEQAYNESPWDQDRWKAFWNEEPWHSWLYVDVDITKPPYSDRYPWLKNIMDDTRPNILSRNFVYKCGKFRDRGTQELVDNFETTEDPGFVDAAQCNFLLKDDSWVYKKIPGFKKIPFDKIGLYIDEYRTALPAGK